MQNRLIVCIASFFLLASVACIGAPTATKTIAPGVEYATYDADGPNKIYVVSADLSHSEYKLRMAYPQKKRNTPYMRRETVSQLYADYNNPPTFSVLAAVNGSRFDFKDIGIAGFLGDAGNIIPGGSNRETYIFTDARWSEDHRDVTCTGVIITCANGTTYRATGINATGGAEGIFVFTPYWDTSTGTTTQGTEVILTNMSYPMRVNKTVTGIVSAVKTGVESVNNAIPAGGMVISASGTQAPLLAASVAVGDRVAVNCGISDPNYNNAQFMITGCGSIVKNGAADPSSWGDYSDGKYPNPRTVLAWDASKLYLVVIDGRQAGVSVGMSFQQEADFLIGTLHVTDAMDVDGGGSSAMVVDGAVMNKPSGGRQRIISNGILLVKEDTSTKFPLTDSFPSTGRTLAWDDKLEYCPVQAFSPTSPGGDGYAMLVTSPAGGINTTHVGDLSDTDYTVESDIYCEYRPGLKGSESYGVFARDNGNYAFTSTLYGGGNCYAMLYNAANGHLQAGKCVKGKFTGFLKSPVSFTSSAWRKMRIELSGSNIKYYVGGKLITSVTDTSFSHGYCGIGYESQLSDKTQIHGARADNFRLLGPAAGSP